MAGIIEVEAPKTPEEKQKAIDQAVSDIEKQYGKGSIIDMHQRVGRSVPCVPTGIYAVDYEVLGIGGLPRGRIVEIYGPESGGKTTLSLKTIAAAQSVGGRAAFIDMEHALDPNWATKQGVDMNDLLVSQPDYGEQALEIAGRLVESAAFDVIVVDSVAALVPKAELDGDIGDSHMGLQARLMSQAMRTLNGKVSRANTILIFINQIREKIGVMFGSPETTTGGRALKFYSSIRLDVRRIAAIKDGENVVGNKVRIKCVKNKVSSPFRETEVALMFDIGFDGDGSLFDVATAMGIVEKSGSWFSYKGERLGQGRTNAIESLRERELFQEVLEAVRERDTQ